MPTARHAPLVTTSRRYHPHGRTREEDLAILADGGETGWWDDSGRPAPWPDNFLHPDSGWAPETGPTGHHDNPRNPPF